MLKQLKRYISHLIAKNIKSMFPITQDTIILGVLIVLLALIFKTAQSEHPFFKKFYRIIPPLFLCYFIPALLNWPLNIIEIKDSQLYYMASRYLLPASLILLCLNIDIKGILNLGSKALIMFLTASLSIIIGGPIALFITINWFPGLITTDASELWRGLSTIAGSWIGGGANQTAMKEIFNVSDQLFASMVVIDIVVANLWMGLLLFGVTINTRINTWLKADSKAIDDLVEKTATYKASIEKIPGTTDLFLLMGAAFGGVAIAHFITEWILPILKPYESLLVSWRLDSLLTGFFWLIVIATTYGLLISFTRLRKLEGVGASKWGSVFIYVLVATIGMQMNLKDIFSSPGLFMVGGIWMLVHILVLLIMAKLIKAPFFFVAVGSQANVGGAASAPVVASAFNIALAPVGVIMAVIGYAVGTYGGIICALLMQWVSI
jgi:uncharacterized membrane protein